MAIRGGPAWVGGWSLALLLAAPAGAQSVSCTASGVQVGIAMTAGSTSRAANCVGLYRCYPPVLGGVSYEILPAGCNPKAQSCSVRATVPAEFPGHAESPDDIGSGALLQWKDAQSAVVGACGLVGSEIFFERGDAWIQIGGFSCAAGASLAGEYTLQADVCRTGCPQPVAERRATISINLSPPQLEAIFCKKPPASGCPGKAPAGACCLGPGGGSSPGGGGGGTGGDGTGPGAHLYYLAGGVGHPDHPGAAVWQPALGRYWSHTYAERIVLDPNDSHVWLITMYGTYVEFSGLSGGVYATTRPSDDYRKLHRTAAGWELRSLDGTVQSFDAAGRWSRMVDRNGNARVADYSAGPLTRVTMPDGRREDFVYHPGGKLAEIREVGIDGTTGRSWLYTWSGDDLVRIARPDGTALEFFYGDARFPGYMTRRDLVATDLARRIEAAWEYDASGNVAKTWRGDPVSNGLNAVDLHTFSYTNPALPTQTAVTDPLGKVTTYTIARDSGSNKPKITKIEGDCPVCASGPNTTMTYADAANPLLPTRKIDGRGFETQYAYNANGRMTSKTEAAGTPLARTMTWQYGNASFPAFPTRIETPSTSGGSALRTTVLSYNASGDLETRTEQGAESGSSFTFATATTYNAAGQPLTMNPPGHGTADVMTYTYDPLRGNLLPATRTDPLIGATLFGYDALNRRTTVTDPNGLQTVTSYDAHDRVTSVIQKGATAADDLATTHIYNAFGDLLRTILPRGNVIEYAYDPAGRLISIERKADTATRRERTFYTLDAYGHRTKEELQRWNGTAWVTDSFTDYVYTSRCHLDKVIHPGGAVTEYGYDCEGNLERVWDPNHPKGSNPTATQTYAYDALNRLTSVTQPWTGAGGGSAVTSYGYDVHDHLTRVTDAEGNITTYTYSDRDLMTRQVSPVSGTTAYVYDEHGELTSETDARGVTINRAVDVLDRVTAVSYPNPDLNIAYTYDDPAVPFSKGRLTRIARPGSVIGYLYDRFGRVLQDGELTYGHDKNSNPSSLVYPGGVEAVTTYDHADRPATLLARRSGKPDQPLVTASAYLSAGPLSSLTLGNGLAETRSFTQRYFPSSITLGSLLNWSYSTDNIGNILSITDVLNATNNRTYGYQDSHYFLTQGNGPWGPRAWTYDKIGNRLTETRGAVTDSYYYLPSPSGRTPILSQIQLGAGGTRTYQYGLAGHLEKITAGTDATTFRNDDAGRLAGLEKSNTGVSFRYDGRSYLTLADADALPFLDGFESGNICAWSGALGIISVPVCPVIPVVRPTYSSEGLLHALTRNTVPERSLVFYFAGRPVAQLELSGGTESWKFLTTDHLGTPVAATSAAGTLLWQGGFEPFGADWSGAGGAGVFLRFPGQWEEGVWDGAGNKQYYNVHRWYEQYTGRYTRPDPLPIKPAPLPYIYVVSRPTVYTDSLGLAPVRNNSPYPIPYKPEENDQLRLCLPGASCEADGVYPPTCSDFPVKLVNGCDAEIGTDGKLRIYCPFFNIDAKGLKRKFPRLGQRFIGGKTTSEFHQDHKDWLIPNGKPFCGCEPPLGLQLPPIAAGDPNI
ncbi:MAG TPA: RHS repeat-associated core domain-containing protein [Thermoanaerobaculia bacterium]